MLGNRDLDRPDLTDRPDFDLFSDMPNIFENMQDDDSDEDLFQEVLGNTMSFADSRIDPGLELVAFETIGCPDDESFDKAAVAAIAWKFDGTPVPAFIKADALLKHLGKSVPETAALDEVLLEDSGQSVIGKGAECFSQRGTVIKCQPDGTVQKATVYVPPKALGNKTSEGHVS